MRVVQILEGYKNGTGTGNFVTAVDELLKRSGIESEIYNHTLNYFYLEQEIKNIFTPDTLVIYHLAYVMDPLVKYLPCKKILMFHNITTPDFFDGIEENMRRCCSSGLYDTRNIEPYFECAIAFSEYSKQILLKSGWSSNKIHVIPLLVRLDKFTGVPDEQIIKKYSDGNKNILFTGRVIFHKKQEDVIKVFENYVKKYEKDARLFLIGEIGSDIYFYSLKEYCKQLGIDHQIIIANHVSFNEYLAYYSIADTFVCMSEHEGFCIPLVEAMYFNIPIIAYNSTAVSDTLNGYGVLFNEKNYNTIAKQIHELDMNNSYRDKILKGLRLRLQELDKERLEDKYLEVIQSVYEGTSIGGYVKRNLDSDFKLRRSFRNYISYENIKNEKVVICGVGKCGKQLTDFFLDEEKSNFVLCDKTGGTGEKYRGLLIETLSNIIEYNMNSTFIITPQKGKIIAEYLVFLLKNKIENNKIYLYEQEKQEIILCSEENI